MVHVVWHACCCLLLAGANVYVACSRPEASNSQEFVLSALVKILLRLRRAEDGQSQCMVGMILLAAG